MITACGRGATYSGKLRARAVELYLNGVKPGYIGWHDLQSTLQKEFPAEFLPVADDLPSPETVMDWVRKHPDAPERLKQLKVQEVAPGQRMPGIPSYPFGYQLQPLVVIPYANTTTINIAALFGHCMALMAMAMMIRFAWSLART